MTEVVITGIGQTEVGEHWEISLRDLALDAIQSAHKDSGGLKPQALFVGNRGLRLNRCSNSKEDRRK